MGVSGDKPKQELFLSLERTSFSVFSYSFPLRNQISLKSGCARSDKKDIPDGECSVLKPAGTKEKEESP
jgi:hypothetical protein